VPKNFIITILSNVRTIIGVIKLKTVNRLDM
jgi:hypothetical protein